MDATYVSTTSFTVVGDQTAIFLVGRRVKCNCGVDGYDYGTILSSTFDTVTTIVLTDASDDITSNLTSVKWASVIPNSIPGTVVTAAANLTANTVVVGDDGAKGVKAATAAVTIPTINLTGGQIAFPATAVPSADPNTLDDYEEGTWTPVPADASSGGNTGSAVTATGRYTKTGDVVVAEVTLTNINTTELTAGNDFYIQGLPFTPGTGNFNGAVRIQNITFAGYLTLASSGSALFLRESASADAGDSVIVSQVGDDAGDVYGSFIYKT